MWDYGSGVSHSGSFDTVDRHEEAAPALLMRINSCGQIYDDVVGFCLGVFPKHCMYIEWASSHNTFLLEETPRFPMASEGGFTLSWYGIALWVGHQ